MGSRQKVQTPTVIDEDRGHPTIQQRHPDAICRRPLWSVRAGLAIGPCAGSNAVNDLTTAGYRLSGSRDPGRPRRAGHAEAMRT